MTLDPVVVRGSETVEAAARTLLARKVRRLPVVDGDGRLIGLFSRSDVIKAALEARQAALG
jgi:CBS domain-containing protein